MQSINESSSLLFVSASAPVRENPPSRVVWIKQALLLCASIVVFLSGGFSNRSFAQQQNPFLPFMNAGFSLRAPDYDDSNDVGQHGAFSVFLAKLATYTFARSSADLCTMSAVADFPDLSIRVRLKEEPSKDLNESSSKNTLAGCVRTAENILMEAVFERDAFDLAVQRAEHDYQPWVFGSKDFNRPEQSIYRLPTVGRAALAELYRSDKIVPALLDIYSEIESDKDAYPLFIAWLDRQRQSHRMGFYVLNEQSGGATRRLIALESTPSIRPVPKRAEPYIDEVHADVPKGVGGRSSILLGCTIERRQTCVRDVFQLLCDKKIGQLVSPLNAEAAGSQSVTRCGVISLLGLDAWIVVEHANESGLRKLRDYLATGPTQRSSAFDRSLVEYVVWIDTN